MNISFRQDQIELFPKDSNNKNESEKPRFLITNITLSLENLVILAIVGIMVMVFSFSLGVDRGKRLVATQEVQGTSYGLASSQGRSGLEASPSGPQQLAEVQAEPSVVTTSDIINSFDEALEEERIQPVAAVAEVPVMEPEAIKVVPDGFTIQVASFKKEVNAEEEAAKLQKNGYETLVLAKGEYSIVCIGVFENQDDAKVFARKLPKRYNDFLIRRL